MCLELSILNVNAPGEKLPTVGKIIIRIVSVWRTYSFKNNQFNTNNYTKNVDHIS